MAAIEGEAGRTNLQWPISELLCNPEHARTCDDVRSESTYTPLLCNCASGDAVSSESARSFGPSGDASTERRPSTSHTSSLTPLSPRNIEVPGSSCWRLVRVRKARPLRSAGSGSFEPSHPPDSACTYELAFPPRSICEPDLDPISSLSRLCLGRHRFFWGADALLPRWFSREIRIAAALPG